MAHVNCPNCGKRLRFSDTSDPIRIQCPICKHTFQTLPASQSPAASDYSEASLGWVAKTSIIVMAMAGIALLAFLVYKVANTGRPDQKEKPPHEIVRAKADRPKPTAISPEKLFAKASPAVVRVVVRDGKFNLIGIGSGFFISEDGLLVTNYHVIEKAKFVTVLLSNKETLFVNGVAAVDAKADLALLKVNGKDLPYLTVAGEKPPKIGAKVYAIGNPQGLTNTLSEGMVSGVRKIKEGLMLIQTTAPISKGSSGGPLLTLNGKVVGVTTFYFRRGQNLNFAVPAGKIAALLKKRGKLQTLASAGGKRLDKTATKELDKAWAAIRKKDWRTAAQILNRLRTTHKDNPFVWFAMGRLHFRLKNYEIAIEHYKAVISLDPDFAGAYHFMGLSYRALKRYPEAIAAYKKAIAIRPSFALLYFGMGEAYQELKRHPEAIAAYKKAIAIKPGYATPAAGNYSFMGDGYRRLKDYPEAIAAYKQAIALKPDYAEAYYGMGHAYEDLGKHSEAIAAYKQAIALKPDYDEAYFYMGLAYCGMGQYPEAIAAYKAAIAIKPHHDNGYRLLGLTCLIMEQYPEAIAAFKAAIVVKPDDAETYYYTGETYEKMGKRTAALAAYQQSLRLEPTGRFADLAQKGIRRLGGEWIQEPS